PGAARSLGRHRARAPSRGRRHRRGLRRHGDPDPLGAGRRPEPQARAGPMTPRERIVAWLRAAPAPLSGEELARRLGCSRAAVWKQIGALRRLGYRIEARRAHGYALAAAPDRLGPAELAPHLAGRWRDIRWLAETDSTQRVARELGRAGAPEGTV